MNIITIIGNGFDLQLGLKTKYTDFFDWLHNRVSQELFADKKEELKQYIINCTDEIDIENKMWLFIKEKQDWYNWYKDLGLFGIYFLLRRNDPSSLGNNWADIESELEDILVNGFESKKRQTYTDLLSYLNGESVSNSSVFNDPIPYIELIFYYQFIYLKSQDGKAEKHSMNYYLEDLKKLEKKFAQYLKSIIPTDYIAISSFLIERILNSAGIYKFETNYILNFNYIMLREKQNSVSDNVHGTLGNLDYMESIEQLFTSLGINNEPELIFGIDESSETSEGMEIFKKTHRKLFLEQSSKKLPETCDYIVVYGHSLAKADYSYFQSLFDLYDIYGSNIKLIFAVNEDAEDISTKANDVYKLLHHYGKRVHGEAKGNNLLHKLLLENRIQLKNIAFLLKLASIKNSAEEQGQPEG